MALSVRTPQFYVSFSYLPCLAIFKYDGLWYVVKMVLFEEVLEVQEVDRRSKWSMVCVRDWEILMTLQVCSFLSSFQKAR